MSNVVRVKFNELQQSFSALVNRAALAWKAGLQFDGARDLYATFGYKRLLRLEDFIIYYLREDMAKRVVNAPADGIWTDPPAVQTEDSAFNEALTSLAKQTDLWATLRRLDILAGLGNYAVLVIGYDDGRRLDQPVRKSSDRKVMYLQPYHQLAVSISKVDTDPTSPRFGKPTLYRVNPGQLPAGLTDLPTTSTVRVAFDVHYSRVLHVAENCLESLIFGHARMECVMNALFDMLKVTGGSAEVFWLTANRGMQVDVDKEMELSQEDADNLSAELDEYMHQQRRIIRTRGVTVNNLGSDVPDPKNTFDVLVSRISSATGMPKRMLIGSEAGQLASQQDRAEWACRLEERQQSFAEPNILRPLIYNFQAAGALPEAAPEDITVMWQETFKMSPLERAQTSAQMARSMANVLKAMETATNIELPVFSVGEARAIVMPGKHMPIFDDKNLPGDPNKGKDIDESATLGTKPEPAPAGGAFGNPPKGDTQ